MIKVLSFLSNENCFAGHSGGPCGPHVARWPPFKHHCCKALHVFIQLIGGNKAANFDLYISVVQLQARGRNVARFMAREFSHY